MSGIIVEDFKFMRRNTLRGFARVRMPSGIIYHDVTIHTKDGRHWAAPPAKPMIGTDGRQMRDRDGKAAWLPVVSFATKEVRDKFSGAIVAAIDAAYPDTFCD